LIKFFFILTDVLFILDDDIFSNLSDDDHIFSMVNKKSTKTDVKESASKKKTTVEVTDDPLNLF